FRPQAFEERAFEALHPQVALQIALPCIARKSGLQSLAVPVREPALEAVGQKLRSLRFASVDESCRHRKTLLWPKEWAGPGLCSELQESLQAHSGTELALTEIDGSKWSVGAGSGNRT